MSFYWSKNKRTSAELKKEIEYVNGDINELKGNILDLKDQIRTMKTEFAKYADLTEWKRDVDVIYFEKVIL